MELLTSDKNPMIKEVRRAASKGAATKDGFALAEGRHLLREAVQSGAEIGAIILTESAREDLLAAELSKVDRAVRILRVSDETFTTLRSTETSQGVITVVRLPEWTFEDLRNPENTPLIVVVDGIQDPGNAGAILRAAEAFSATGVVFLKGSTNPYNPKCLRASAGSIFRLPVVTGFSAPQFIQALDEADLPLYAADPRAATLLSASNLADACAIVIGAEGSGVSAELLEHAKGIRIPTAGVESLNAAVAAGVLLYEANRQRA